jgi:hypothetical protein
MTPKTPVILEDFRPDLAELVAREAEQRWSVVASAASLNHGGWKSDDLRVWGAQGSGALLDALRDEIATWGDWPYPRPPQIDAWVMVNLRGSYHPSHTHRTAMWSGVYFLRTGGPDSPPTIFEPSGPGRRTTRTTKPEIHVAPAVGRLVVFPADLHHRVPPHPSDDPRVTVAFEVK